MDRNWFEFFKKDTFTIGKVETLLAIANLVRSFPEFRFEFKPTTP